MKRPTTTTIAGRTYPSCVLVCPLHEDDPEASEYERSLGASPGDITFYIPAENGVLFAVEPDTAEAAQSGNLRLILYTVACQDLAHDGVPESMWLPYSVRWENAALTAGPMSYWWNAEPEWVVETIDRLSRMRFEIPDGPRVTMHPTDYFADEEIAS